MPEHWQHNGIRPQFDAAVDLCSGTVEQWIHAYQEPGSSERTAHSIDVLHRMSGDNGIQVALTLHFAIDFQVHHDEIDASLFCDGSPGDVVGDENEFHD